LRERLETAIPWHCCARHSGRRGLRSRASIDRGAREPASSGGPVAVRRLTQEQYRQTIGQLFGPDIKVGGRFEPDLRPENGLIADGSSQVAVTPAGFEQYDALARSIADQVVDKNHRDILVTCKPASAKAPGDACARQFLAKTGRLLFRRPLTQDELNTDVQVAHDGAARLNVPRGVDRNRPVLKPLETANAAFQSCEALVILALAPATAFADQKPADNAAGVKLPDRGTLQRSAAGLDCGGARGRDPATGL
jgi:hypothetical protein